MIVAHRGASSDAPENTIEAFELAWRQGADAIEGDFHSTADGRVVCVHDAKVKTVAGDRLVVADSTLEELRAARPDLPTLEQVLATVPSGKSIYIEIKCGPEILPALREALRASDLNASQISVISFNERVIERLKKVDPTLTANWLIKFKRNRQGKVAPSQSAVLETLDRIGANGLGAGQAHLSERFVGEARKRGFNLHVWTVDDPKAAERFLGWGARSITTNVPGEMKSALAQRGWL